MIFFSTFEKVLDYLNKAGKPVPGYENTFYDEPAEYRWDYVVVEKVSEGPHMGIGSKVMGWWRAEFNKEFPKTMVLSYKEIEWPKELEGTFNFTGIG
jgi:hypothetical protein